MSMPRAAYVRGDEEPDGAFAQPGKDIFAAALGQVGGQLVGVESKALQYGGHEVHRSLVLQKMMAEAGFSSSRT